MGLEPDVNEIIVTHVDPGDTLSEITARYGVSVDELQQWNRIENSDFVQIGQRILVYKVLDASDSSASEGAVFQAVPGPDVVVGSWDVWRYRSGASAVSVPTQTRCCNSGLSCPNRATSRKRWRAIGPFGVEATLPRLDAA